MEHATLGEDFSIPTTCYGAVVKNEGPEFYVEVEELPVPEISAYTPFRSSTIMSNANAEPDDRASRGTDSTQCNGFMYVRYPLYDERLEYLAKDVELRHQMCRP